jgi:IS30 family transposase
MPLHVPRLSPREKLELWHRWRQGQSLSEIGRALGKAPASVFSLVRAGGGLSPPARRRGERALSSSEREEISRGLSRGEPLRRIAARLGRAPSTVSREVKRNGGARQYRAGSADGRAWQRARRPKRCKLALNRRLQRYVALKLSQNWSPAQISGWLEQRFRDDDDMRISHETIYRSLFIQARGVLKKELQGHLRSRRKMRHSKRATTKGQPRGQIIDAVSIRERPPEVQDRAVPGHWEGDLISGSKNSHIATLVERQSRFALLVKVRGKDATSVTGAVKRRILKLPAELRRSLTWDRGMEMAQHREFSVKTDVRVYFCDPQSPWQRGTNENTNRLLRQYFPKGADLSLHSQADLNKVARQLNSRPRKTLGFQTPAEVFQAALP